MPRFRIRSLRNLHADRSNRIALPFTANRKDFIRVLAGVLRVMSGFLFGDYGFGQRSFLRSASCADHRYLKLARFADKTLIFVLEPARRTAFDRRSAYPISNEQVLQH